MENYTMLLMAFVILIFIGLISRNTGNVATRKERFRVNEPPHLLRRLGLSPPDCPFRDQY